MQTDLTHLTLAHQRLAEASQDTRAWPMVPGKCLIAFRALVKSRACARDPLPTADLTQSMQLDASKTGTVMNLLCALLSHYAPGVRLHRRNIGNRVWGYWLESGEAPLTPADQSRIANILKAA